YIEFPSTNSPFREELVTASNIPREASFIEFPQILLPLPNVEKYIPHVPSILKNSILLLIILMKLDPLVSSALIPIRPQSLTMLSETMLSAIWHRIPDPLVTCCPTNCTTLPLHTTLKPCTPLFVTERIAP